MTRGEVEAVALGLPATEKVVQWGDHDVFKVGGKVFAISGEDSLSFKATEIGFMALTEGGPGRQAPYLAKGQWVNVALADAGEDEVRDWIRTSYDLIAAKLTRKARAELGIA
ncbi:MmcQ/YjbR family DNA-binding protein [Phenylobacterium deserti]|uniref:MmcQ/YjbR family DNA-binding protein n=1 Tax=Phenylobacterium deserti TaxID=1914756 RepID=A0A328ARK3_9CAUL|nr:MmcQ/YjbR family DNA-binding protein [Phenylobacterium deserti]RAK56881.1 MmcQ/YjbR family DNA-binding protein [Phenylobacterium deserti]